MAAPSSATLFSRKEEELKNHQNQQLQHSPGEGAVPVMASSPPGAASQGRKRSHSGNPSHYAEVIALSPRTRESSFPREQNLQLHIRRHNMPWEIKQNISGTGEDYKCACGRTMSRRDNIVYYCSFCHGLAEKVARPTTNSVCNPGSMSLGSAEGSMNPRNSQQLSSPPFRLGASRSNSFTSLPSGQPVGSVFLFQPIQPSKMHLHPVPEPKLSFPRASDFSGNHGLPSYTAPSNMFNFGFSGGADFNSPPSGLDLHISNSFGGLMMNAEASAYKSTLPSPQLSATALLQKAAMTGANSNNAYLMKSMGSHLSGGMKFNNYGGALGDGMSGGGRGGGSAFQEMSNNLNVGGGSYGSAGGYGGGMEYVSDHQMNAPYGGMTYNVKNADGMLVGEVNNNVLVEPQMDVQSEYSCDKFTRDFLGMENGMNRLSGGGMVDDHNGNGMGTKSPESEATTSAEARPFVPDLRLGF